MKKVIVCLSSKEIGRWLETIVSSPPLKTGETSVSLKQSGTSPLCNDWLKREQTGRDISTANSRMIRLLMPSGPEALPTGSDLNMNSTSLGVRVMELKVSSTG